MRYTLVEGHSVYAGARPDRRRVIYCLVAIHGQAHDLTVATDDHLERATAPTRSAPLP